ncbi:helix-turn-helix domain-containing protein [Aliarcobacter butzleri]|uniref:helix-turn-helix domain-containing protein n=1 Tax=Aliarcobacter butzleri TaxID=28197 RepID=UPI001EDA6E4D|nr:helix-turn-helix transcriptional regulator [Aliarcobacter butzleri]MCG3690103.1 helix-turn-helix transcriptional regulator [Aliarcobacter butzleri]
MSKGKLLEIVIFDNLKIDCIVHDEFMTEDEIKENIEAELLEIFGTKEDIASKLHYVEILEPSKDEPFTAVFFANLNSKTYYYGTKGNKYRIHGMNKEDALERKKYSYSTNNENIVKKVCTELGITQKELAEELGMKPTALSNWANGDIPQIAQKALELLLENKKLKENFKILKKAHKILSE